MSDLEQQLTAAQQVDVTVTRLREQGFVTTEQPTGFTTAGLTALSDLAIVAMMTGQAAETPVDAALAETARALLNLVGAVSADAAGQPSTAVAPLVREAEQALRAASKHAKQF